MKWLLIVVALSICLEVIAAKNSEKSYPKKVKNKKPTKGPKSILDEFSALSEDDKEFIKELDKQFKLHGDQIKIKVERDNSTAKNPKRTIDGELGYGQQSGIQFPRFQFTKPKFQIYPYSQRDIPPYPFNNGYNGANNAFYPGSFPVQPSQAFFGYQAFAPNRQPFHPQFTTRPTIIPTSLSTSSYPTTKYPSTTAFPATSPFPTTPYPTAVYPAFQRQQPQPIYPIQQQYSEPVIVLRIPGPAKYAAHLQTLLQRYLEIRAAQYIRAFEEHEARVAQQQEFLRQQQQHYPETQSQAYQSLIRTTDFYKPGNQYMVPTPGPVVSIQPQHHSAPIQQFHQFQQPHQIQQFQQPHQIPQFQQPHPAPAFQQPKQLSVQIQQPQFPAYQQQFIVQKVPAVHESLTQTVQHAPHDLFVPKPAQATAAPERIQVSQDYLDQKPQQQLSLGENIQQAQEQDYQRSLQQNKEYLDAVQPTQSFIPTKAPSFASSLPTTQKPPEFSLTNVLQNRGFFSAKPNLLNFPSPSVPQHQEQQELNNPGEEEIDDQPELPEARHQPTYSTTPIGEAAHRDEDQQLFSYDQQEQISITQRPHKIYGAPNPTPSPEPFPISENNPHPTHTRIRFKNDGKSDDHSSNYPLPPIPSTTPKFDYEKPQQGYETIEQETYGTEEPIVAITQKQRLNGGPLSGYNSHSLINADFRDDAPYTQSQFKKLNELINRLKQRSAAIISSVGKKESTASDE